MKYDYYYVTNLYSSDECSFIKNKFLSNLQNDVTDMASKNATKTASVQFCDWSVLWEELDLFHHAVMTINHEYFGLDLHERSKFNLLNLNTYDSANKGEYTWHKDASLGGSSDIKLTAILNISDGHYEGGDFQFFLDGEETIEAIHNSGSLLVFPGFINHRVLPVTKGKRNTISYWYSGPAWK